MKRRRELTKAHGTTGGYAGFGELRIGFTTGFDHIHPSYSSWSAAERHPQQQRVHARIISTGAARPPSQCRQRRPRPNVDCCAAAAHNAAMASHAPRIQGPIISTSDLDAWEALLTEVFGMQADQRQALDQAAVQALWGVQGRRATTQLLITPQTGSGIRLLAFEPASSIVIRNQATGFDADALKVIDFYAPDFKRAAQVLADAGFALKDEVAEYDLAEGHFIEGHLWGPDQVVCALVSGPRHFFARFATITDRVVSEVQSVSCPVTDPASVIAFYAEVIGLNACYEYQITDKSFQHLVGAAQPLSIKAVNIGRSTVEPYLGIIHYGLPKGSFTSLAERAVLPNRGLAGVTLMVDDVAPIVHRALPRQILAGPALARLEPWGKITSALVRAPHGVLHHLVQPE